MSKLLRSLELLVHVFAAMYPIAVLHAVGANSSLATGQTTGIVSVTKTARKAVLHVLSFRKHKDATGIVSDPFIYLSDVLGMMETRSRSC